VKLIVFFLLYFLALYSFAYWPKVAMLDQDMKSVTEFRALAQEILNRSQPAALTEARLQPARFKITPRKLRSVRLVHFLNIYSQFN